MKFKELSQLSTQDLKLKLDELKKELVKLNAQVSTGTAVKNPGQIKKAKKTIARILTILNSKNENKAVKSAEVRKKA